MDNKTSYNGWNDPYNGKSVQHKMPTKESQIIDYSKAPSGVQRESQSESVPHYQRYFTKADAQGLLSNELEKRVKL